MSRWFISQSHDCPAACHDDHATPRIFCFPHAGGSPRAFLGWQDYLAGAAEIVAVCRPGREHRAAESAPSIGELIDGAAAAIAEVTADDDRPFYLFGHSLGALVAFEVCRKLPSARHFIASGCSAPVLLPSARVLRMAQLTGAAFASEIAFFGGLAPEVVADPDLRDVLLPGLIADFRMAVGYRYRPAAEIAVPATIVVGRDDPHVRDEQVGPWRQEFTWPPEVRWVAGGHFYFDQDPAVVTGILREVVSADQQTELI
jgi:surfactin synthase thioesterase subunit